MDYKPTSDSPCVDRLKGAGAIIVGKTNTPEFGLFWRTVNLLQRETVNPWNVQRTCGGSSIGVAASVSVGMTPLAIGAGAAGSIRLPDAFCGVSRMLPSLGRVPRFGVIDGRILSTGIGPITRDVRDMALALSVMSGPDPRDPTCISEPIGDLANVLDAGVKGFRFAWWENPAAIKKADPHVIDLVKEAAVQLASQGAGLDESDFDLDVDRYYEAFHSISSADRYARVGQQQQVFGDPAIGGLLSPMARQRFIEGRQVTGAEYSRAISARFVATSRLEAAFDRYDVILSPTVPYTAPLIPDHDMTCPRDLVHLPCQFHCDYGRQRSLRNR